MAIPRNHRISSHLPPDYMPRTPPWNLARTSPCRRNVIQHSHQHWRTTHRFKMQLGLSESLSTLVARRFTAAKDGGFLVYSPTQLANIHASGIPYQLRYCPALAKKTSALPKPSDEGEQPKQKPDPFDNPAAELLVTEFPPGIENHKNGAGGYRLVLNKFPVIPNHFILATREWKSQTDLLAKEDLEATYACIKTWDEEEKSDGGGTGKRLFAFFNSGPDSGASQPHRHIQFLPVEAMMEQPIDEMGTNGLAWKPLIDLIMESKSQTQTGYRCLDQLPFAHFALPLPPNPSADTLHAIYLSLYRAAVSTAKEEDANLDGDGAQTSGPSAISHNLAMTESAMMICPRRNETAKISVDKNAAGGDDVSIAQSGVLALNGTILAGTLMVKAEAEWNELRQNPENLVGALRTVGYATGLGRASL